MASIGQIIFWSMIVLIFLMAGFIILLLAIAFSVSQGSVVTNTPFPVGNLGDDVLLGCKFQTKTGQISSSVSITWQKDGLSGVVYQYQNNGEHLQDQNPQFKNKVKLFLDSIPSGNASLLLRTVMMEDEGVYRCSVTTSGVTGTASIRLRVGAFSAPNITMSNNNSLTAIAPRWLPKPDVTWTALNGSQLNSDTQFSTLTMGIVQVTSNLQVQVSDGIYTCIIQNALVTALSKATVLGNEVSTKTDFTFNSSPTIVTSFVTSTSIILFCILLR